MASAPAVEGSALDEHCLRHLVSRQPLAIALWSPDCREALANALETVYGADNASDVMKGVSDQIVVTSFRRIARVFELYSQQRGDLLSCPRIFNAIKVLENIDLEDEAAFLLLQALVHTALHFVCASSDVATACPTAIALMHRAERADEPTQIADLRLKGIQLIKSCSRKGLRHGRKAMVLNAVRYEQECPIGQLVTELQTYAQGIADCLGELWGESSDSASTRTGRREAAERSRVAEIDRNLRRRNHRRKDLLVPTTQISNDLAGDNDECAEEERVTPQKIRRGRGRKENLLEIDDVVRSTSKRRKKRSRPVADDSDSQTVGVARLKRRRGRRKDPIIHEGDFDDGESTGKHDLVRKSTPPRQNGSIREPGNVFEDNSGGENVASTPTSKRVAKMEWVNDENDETDGLEESTKETLRDLDGATARLRRDRGEDPLETAIAQSRKANQGNPRRKDMYNVDKNAREVTPIDDDVSSDDESEWRPHLPRLFPSKLVLNGDSEDELPKSHIPASKSKAQKKSKLTSDVRKGSFSREEDKILIEGLKKYGWSEWQRIANNCWNHLPYKRLTDSVKDRARYLQRQARIRPEDYPPPYGYKRSGPPSTVPATLRTTAVRRSPRKHDAGHDEEAGEPSVEEDLDQDEDTQDPNIQSEIEETVENREDSDDEEEIEKQKMKSSPKSIRSPRRRQLLGSESQNSRAKKLKNSPGKAEEGPSGNEDEETQDVTTLKPTQESSPEVLRRSSRRKPIPSKKISARKTRSRANK